LNYTKHALFVNYGFYFPRQILLQAFSVLFIHGLKSDFWRASKTKALVKREGLLF